MRPTQHRRAPRRGRGSKIVVQANPQRLRLQRRAAGELGGSFPHPLVDVELQQRSQWACRRPAHAHTNSDE
jgi:hypothetical protein